MLHCTTSRLTNTTPTNVSWNSSLWQNATVTPRENHWLIQRIDTPQSNHQPELYLQIATGVWCSSSRATKFPTRHSAMAYATEYGLTLGQTARLVRPAQTMVA